jgi:hypothetical protein
MNAYVWAMVAKGWGRWATSSLGSRSRWSSGCMHQVRVELEIDLVIPQRWEIAGGFFPQALGAKWSPEGWMEWQHGERGRVRIRSGTRAGGAWHHIVILGLTT